MTTFFSKLFNIKNKNLKSKENKPEKNTTTQTLDTNNVEELKILAQPFFNFVEFIHFNGVNFYQNADVEGKEMMFVIEPSKEQVNEWIVEYFKYLKYIEENK